MGRTLIEIPEIHGLAKVLGRLMVKYQHIAEETGQSFQEVMEENKEEQEVKIKEFQSWGHILTPFYEQLIPFALEYSPQSIYCDGITSLDELDTMLVRAHNGEIIDKLIFHLKGEGAEIIPAENPEYLQQGDDDETHREYIPKRDQHIAEVINETLPEDSIGILFMGAAHNVGSKLRGLESDIEIIRPEFAKETLAEYVEIHGMPDIKYGLINPENWD